jgi:hypothetical protein
MIATSKRGRLFVGALYAGLALPTLGFGAGAATASSWQPAPADIPLLPTPSDPGPALPIGSGPVGLPNAGGLMSPGAGGLMPLIGDTTKLIAASSDPHSLVANTQSMLNDVGSLLAVPVGMPNVSSLIPTTGVPNVGAPLAPSSPLAPVTDLTPSAPVTPLAPPGPAARGAPLGPLL